MASNLQLQSDAGVPVTSWNFGAIAAAANSQQKFRVKNIGDQLATSVALSAVRLLANDGIDFVEVAPNASGNPGAYTTAALSFGTMNPGDITYFWVRVTVPTGTSPAGNPRQFDIQLNYTGT